MDHLHDAVLLLIFNRIGDFRTLCRCCAVSRRFNDLTTQVDNLVLKIDTGTRLSADQSSLSRLFRLISLLDVIDLHVRTHCRFLGNWRLAHGDLVGTSPVLNKFKEIRVLKIELPSGYFYADHDNGMFVKWKAECRPGFLKCVTVSAAAVATEHADRKPTVSLINSDSSNSCAVAQSNIVCSIGFAVAQFAALATQCLPGIVAEHSKLDSFVLTDADEPRGVLCMTRLRELAVFAETMKPIPVLKLNTRARHADEVSLTNGLVLKGVSLAAVWPCEQSATCDLANTFEEPYETSLRMWMSMVSDTDGLLYTRPLC